MSNNKTFNVHADVIQIWLQIFFTTFRGQRLLKVQITIQRYHGMNNSTDTKSIDILRQQRQKIWVQTGE